MSVGTITADGSTEWVKVRGGRNMQLSLNGSFGGGTAAIEKLVDGNTYALYDVGTAITATAAEDMRLTIGKDVSIRITLAGSTTPALVWSISSIG